MTTEGSPSLVERVARVVHEANRAWDNVRGVTPGPPWEQAEEWQREAAMKGVRLALAGAPPSQLHEAWRRRKLAEGWTPGDVKDPQAKTDPMLVPYTQLSGEDRRTPELVAAIGLTAEDRSDPCESFSRPRSWARKELHDEASQAHAGADHPEVAGG